MCHPVAKLQDSLGLQQDPNDPMWPIVNGAPAQLHEPAILALRAVRVLPVAYQDACGTVALFV